MQAELLVTAQAQFTQVKGHHVGKTHLVGKIQFDQLVIDLDHMAAGAKSDDAAPTRLDTAGDYLGGFAGSLAGAFIGIAHDRSGHFLVSRQRGEFYLIFGTIIPAGNLIQLDIRL